MRRITFVLLVAVSMLGMPAASAAEVTYKSSTGTLGVWYFSSAQFIDGGNGTVAGFVEVLYLRSQSYPDGPTYSTAGALQIVSWTHPRLYARASCKYDSSWGAPTAPLTCRLTN